MKIKTEKEQKMFFDFIFNHADRGCELAVFMDGDILSVSCVELFCEIKENEIVVEVERD